MPRLHVVLYHPEIPQNTGNIGRTCVALGARLWLVRPLGYSLDDKYLKRAGLDYWQFLDWRVVDDLAEVWQEVSPSRCWILTKHARKLLWEAEFQPGDVLLFGNESSGLPAALRESMANRALRLPMTAEVRSLNLSSAATTVMYEAIRQSGDWSFDVPPQ